MRNISLSSQQHVCRGPTKKMKMFELSHPHRRIMRYFHVGIFLLHVSAEISSGNSPRRLNSTWCSTIFHIFSCIVSFFWVLLLSEMRREIPPLMWVLCVLSELRASLSVLYVQQTVNCGEEKKNWLWCLHIVNSSLSLFLSLHRLVVYWGKYIYVFFLMIPV